MFLVDTLLSFDMFFPIAKEFKETLFVNYEGWSKEKRAIVSSMIRGNLLDCIESFKYSRKEVQKLMDLKPQIIVMARDTTNPFESLVIEEARKANIKTLLIPHGIWAREARIDYSGSSWIEHCRHLAYQGLRLLKYGPSIRLFQIGMYRLKRDLSRNPVFDGHGGTDMIAVYGDKTRELLVSEGLESKKICVTGNPKFDRLYLLKNTQGKDVLLITDYLVEIGKWTKEQRRIYVQSVVDAVNKLGKKLVIKIHPLENEKDYQFDAEIVKNRDLGLLISESKIVITLLSTAGLEAMAMNRPVVIYNLFNDKSLYSLGVYTVRESEKLYPTLRDILETGMKEAMIENMNKFVFDNAYLQDGQSYLRITNLMKVMI